MEMSQNINKTMRHLKFCYISILTNLLRTDQIFYGLLRSVRRRFVRTGQYIIPSL